MNFDPNSLIVGGVSAFVIVLFIVQTIKEAFDIESRYIPLLAAGTAISLLVGAVYLPDSMVSALAQGLALAGTVSLAVRYVKESPNAREGHNSTQGYDSETERYYPPITKTESTGRFQRYAGVRNLGTGQSGSLPQEE